MPLRDHFDSPVKNKHPWEALHAMWPAMIVRQLFDILPTGYTAAPGVHLGKAFEIDVSAFEVKQTTKIESATGATDGNLAVATLLEPTLTVETDLPDLDEYEVRIYDEEYERRLVAAIEIVSPSNKDRPASRRAFVAKAAALLQKDVCVSVIDLVTIRHFNFFTDVLDFVADVDSKLGEPPPHIYAATIRTRKAAENQPKERSLLDAWFYPMTLEQPLPTLPIWLDTDRRVMLPLEPSYEETCRLLRIT